MFYTRTRNIIGYAQNVTSVKLLLRGLIWKLRLLVDFKATKLSSLAIFSSTIRLCREVILALWTSKWVSGVRVRVRLREVAAYGRLRIESFSRKIAIGPQGGVRLWELVSAYGSCPLAEFDCTSLLLKLLFSLLPLEGKMDLHQICSAQM